VANLSMQFHISTGSQNRGHDEAGIVDDFSQTPGMMLRKQLFADSEADDSRQVDMPPRKKAGAALPAASVPPKPNNPVAPETQPDSGSAPEDEDWNAWESATRFRGLGLTDPIKSVEVSFIRVMQDI
jgi:hypothetical protein